METVRLNTVCSDDSGVRPASVSGLEGQLQVAIAGLPCLCVEVVIEAQTHIELPSFSGSTFRGLLGHQLKRAACKASKVCEECLQPELCIYHYLFETESPSDWDPKRGSSEAPRPYVLIPPQAGRVLPAKQRTVLKLRLFGKATEYLSYFLYALEQSGQRGVGRHRQRFHVVEARQINPGTSSVRFYQGHQKRSSEFVKEVEQRSLLDSLRDVQMSERLSLDFLTPTRLKYRGALVKYPPFHVMVRALLRRLELLCAIHGSTPLSLDFRKMIDLAELVRTVEHQLHWMDWQRHSNRQKRRMKLGGFLGRITYEGDITPFTSLLGVGELINVGKNTTFGLGEYRICNVQD